MKLKVRMLLTSEDIKTMQNMLPVYLDQVGQYFYINKITKFRPKKLSEVELIKIDVS